jgi:hypothetical protein
MPVIYFASKEKPKVEENKVDIIGDVESSILEEMKESEDSSSVMNEDFFGKQQSQEAIEFDPSPPEKQNKQQTRWQEQQELSQEKDQPVFAAKNIFITAKDLLPQEEKPAITPIVSKPQSEVIVHAVKSPKNNKSAALELLADKDYPSSIASKAYDLSRCSVPLNNGQDFDNFNLSKINFKQVNFSEFKIQYRYINKEDLWCKFYMHAPRLRLPLEKKFNNLKRASLK